MHMSFAYKLLNVKNRQGETEKSEIVNDYKNSQRKFQGGWRRTVSCRTEVAAKGKNANMDFITSPLSLHIL